MSRSVKEATGVNGAAVPPITPSHPPQRTNLQKDGSFKKKFLLFFGVLKRREKRNTINKISFFFFFTPPAPQASLECNAEKTERWRWDCSREDLNPFGLLAHYITIPGLDNNSQYDWKREKYQLLGESGGGEGVYE